MITKKSISNIKAVFKREIAGYSGSAAAYVFIVIFLLLPGFFTFPAVITAAFPSRVCAADITVFGPKQYQRTDGGPDIFTDSFSVQNQGDGRLIITNGDETGKHRVTAAEIFLNNVKISGAEDFKQNVYVRELPVTPAKENTLRTELRSRPGTYLNITVIQKSMLSVQITSPLSGAAISRSDIMVRGTLTGAGDETGVTVNGIPAVVYGSEFAANHVPLDEGQNTITVVATGTDGNTAEASVTVSVQTAERCIRLIPVRAAGLLPFETSLRTEVSSGSEPSLTYTGYGQAEIIKTSDGEYTVKITAEGIYYFTAQVQESQGNILTDTVGVVTADKKKMISLFNAKWNGMSSALRSGDIETALTYFVSGTRERYGKIFTAYSSSEINAIFSDTEGVGISTLYEHTADCGIIRAESGGKYSYPLTFVKDEYGIWKIMGF